MQELWPQLKHWIEKRRPFAIATVVTASRPAPRPKGATLIISADGTEFLGSVSAGCVENEVIERAQACLEDQQTRWASFGASQGTPWEIALTCGGRISVRIDPFDYEQAFAEALARCLETQTPAVLLHLNEKRLLVEADGSLCGDATQWRPETIEQAKTLCASGAPTQEIETPEGKVLLRSLARPNRLFVVGAVHIATHLLPIARALCLRTILIDPRDTYANPDRFPTRPDELINEWPKQILSERQPSERDFAVLLTHDPKIDDNALECLLESSCAYIGALGSPRSHRARQKRLQDKGFTPEQIARIHGPVGLDIGSRTPAEIAVSIAAELIEIRNRHERSPSS